MGRLLGLRGVKDEPVSPRDAKREAFRGTGLLSFYRLIGSEYVVSWSFNTLFANPPFITLGLICNGKEQKKKKHSLRNATANNNNKKMKVKGASDLLRSLLLNMIDRKSLTLFLLHS